MSISLRKDRRRLPPLVNTRGLNMFATVDVHDVGRIYSGLDPADTAARLRQLADHVQPRIDEADLRLELWSVLGYITELGQGKAADPDAALLNVAYRVRCLIEALA